MCPKIIIYNVLITLTLILVMLMTKWWPWPNAKASPSSLQATADTGESRSSASRDTYIESIVDILMFWCLRAKQYWWTQYIVIKIISNTMVTLTLSGAWWPWICQRKACLKKKTFYDIEDIILTISIILKHHLRTPPVRTSSNNDILKRTPSGHVNVALVAFQEHQSGNL